VTVGNRGLHAATLAIILAACAVAAGAPAARAETVGAVRQIRSYAYGTPPQEARRPIYPRDAVVANEELETVAQGAMIIRFQDQTELTLGENAKVVIDQFVYDPNTSAGRSVVNLSKGAFRFVTGKMNKEGITIETPTATIGVRGTTLRIFCSSVLTRVIVDEGQAVVRQRGSAAPPSIVNVGQHANVGSGAGGVGTGGGGIVQVVNSLNGTGDRVIDRTAVGARGVGGAFGGNAAASGNNQVSGRVGEQTSVGSSSSSSSSSSAGGFMPYRWPAAPTGD